jgi:hypothetical protein
MVLPEMKSGGQLHDEKAKGKKAKIKRKRTSKKKSLPPVRAVFLRPLFQMTH